MNMDSGKTVVLAALGRPFSLGMLYDCRNDSLIPALTLWDREALEKDADERPQPNIDFEIVASDSIEDKFSALNVEASLKASFLCGLVEVDGSAQFLKNPKISRNQARVTLKYKTTTKFKELSMNYICRGNVKHPDVFESGKATHVVTGILYGAQAFFVFDREVSEKEDRQDIEGNLKVLIKKIPTLKIGGQGSLNTAEKDMANVDKLSCNFHGDFNLEKHSVSFHEAIQVYQSLPKLTGTNGENAVPQKVWLMPLKNLDSAAAELVRQISDRFIKEAQNVLEYLSELERRCNDAEQCTTTQQFPQINKKLKDFKELVSQYKLEFQNTLARKLPLIRGGGEEESVLAKILKKVHSSPFKSGELNEWMESKETEIKIISSLIDQMPNMNIITSRNSLQLEIHSGDTTHALCFVFTSLEGPEPYLSALSKYLDETQPDDKPCVYDLENEQWFLSNVIYEKIKLFKDFAVANQEKKSIKFLAGAIKDDEKKGATLHLYKDGSLANNNFEPPSKPEMTTGDITHNSVTLNISPPRFGLTTVTHYTVEFCVDGEDVWRPQMESMAGDVTVSGLKINEEYQFRCRAWCAVGLGPACEVSPLIKTLPSSPPEKLQVECYSTELSVSWEKPSDLGRGVETKQYILEYAETSLEENPEECKWSKPIFTAKLVKVIPGLQPSTRYTVRVRCDCGVFGLGKEESVVVCTKKLSDKLATSIKALSKEIEYSSPSVFKLPLEKNDVRIDGCKRYTFGNDCVKPNRTVMFMGATGSGKSTLINGMMNYILGIDWKDSFRFKLINEDQSKSQAESQTTHVTTYKINHQEGFKVPYSLTLVDTPGFGDTRGIESDKAITEQIRSLFTSAKGVVEIDAICFVTQASQVRLTASQKYVFDSVLSIFGKDVAENICILVTFADGQQPPVLEAINAAKIPCPKTHKDLPVHHKFNNSALFAENKSFSDRADQDSKSSKYPEEKKMDVNNFDAMFWAMGASSMETFFTALGQMTTKSLQLTKEVLEERKQLEVSVEGIQPQVRAGLAKLEQIRSTQQQIEKHTADISCNENFQIEVEITKCVKTDLTKEGEFITNCQQCHMTCHYPCIIADDLKKSGCGAMKDGKCTVCPGKCAWNLHFNQKYKFDYVKEKQVTTIQELKEKYEKATEAKMTVQQLIEIQKEEVAHLQDEIILLMDASSACLARLKEIALRPDPLSTPEYIELLIEGERSEGKAGYLERIQSLDKMKGTAQIIAKVAKGEKLTKIEEKIVEGRKQREKKKGFVEVLGKIWRSVVN
uniref:Fibronectin type-III domain-containing protein n=1 Tax=Gadus morhua TaxID=8049 RepID=A0A8C5BQV2_GADMO